MDAAVLEDNPEFASLHNTLSNVILNADGSTKADPASKEREAVRKVSPYAISLPWLCCI